MYNKETIFNNNKFQHLIMRTTSKKVHKDIYLPDCECYCNMYEDCVVFSEFREWERNCVCFKTVLSLLYIIEDSHRKKDTQQKYNILTSKQWKNVRTLKNG